MKRILEYIKDVRWWVSHYDSNWWNNKQNRRTAIGNALYCTAPAQWKTYNKILKVIFY
ncbi:MAG: hypothetical protein MJ062_03285 [Oscillospiraceae bacterium]|nr:hypothetical protein [Oscillospiraceae bacterium]